MKIEPEKKVSLLAPLADAYGPTPAQRDRLFAKLEASLAPDLDEASSPDEPKPPSAGRGAMAWAGRSVPLIGLSFIVLAIGGALVLRESSRGPAVATTTVAVPVMAQAVDVPVPRDPEAAPSISVDALPAAAIVHSSDTEVRSVPLQRPVPMSASTSASSSENTLAREARLLSDARRALKNGDVAGALALLDEHARVFPRGALVNERMAERIVVLCSLGRRTDAVREAAIFLDGRPKGALTRRVEMSCAGRPGTEDER